ncbi:hypothetical protein [Rhizobium sp. NFR03]|nr:hypothetical protein [Rhizobium sp. NFR03]
MKMRYFVILAAIAIVVGIILFGTMPSHDDNQQGGQPSPSALDQNP